ncbi:hypothetical protein VTL71DRAFT_2776 [Oculimacula yallundae]|uniref:Chromo domain-containing protein n=1 Tax=Oculimacula yallundae TaxID=86028 RepID=A0ABR4CA05_9HELO
MPQTSIRPKGVVVDDDISLDSTESESYGSDTEFTVDRILAEKSEEREKYYLISWEGYPEEKNTWEPEANIGSDTLEEWHERLEREQKGLDEPYDLANFYALLKRLEAEKADRHQRRVVKRQKIKKARLEALAERERRRKEASRNSSDSSSEAIEDFDEVDDAPGINRERAKKRRSSVTKPNKRPIKTIGRLDDNLSDAEIESRAKKRVSTNHVQQTNKLNFSRRPSESSSEEVPLVQQKAASQPRTSSSNEPSIQQRKSADIIAKSLKPAYAASRVSTTKEPLSRLLARGGKGATRGGSHAGPRHVFTDRGTVKARPNLLKNSTDPSKEPKPYTNMRLGYQAFKQGRAVADRAPDVTKLPGGLMDPSKPVPYVDPSALRNPVRQATDSEPVPNELFVPAHSPIAQVPEAYPAPVYQQSQLKSGREVCFFWHRHQKNKYSPDCSNTYDCNRLHYYEPGALISDAPPGWVDPGYGPEVCFFWHTHQENSSRPPCKSGDDCPRLHHYEDGVKISPAPPGYVYLENEEPPPHSLSPIHDHAQDDSPMEIDHEDDYSHHDKPDIHPPWQEPVAVEEISNIPNETSSRGETISASERRPYRSTCYFWDLAQVSTINPPCRNGDNCTYLHHYEKGVPIAPSPKGVPDLSDRFGSSWAATSQPPGGNPNLEVLQVRTQPSRLANMPSLPGEVSSRQEKTSSSHNGSSRDLLARPPWDPHHSEHAICYFWHATGTCNKGRRCKYYHDLDPSLPVAPSPEKQVEIRRETTCVDWARGHCHHTDCWFMHGYPPLRGTTTSRQTYDPLGALASETHDPEGRRSDPEKFGHRYYRDLPPDDHLKSLLRPDSTPLNEKAGPATSPSGPSKDKYRVSRPLWDYDNPDNAICYFYHNEGHCNRQNACRFHHSGDPNLPIAPAPGKAHTFKARFRAVADDIGMTTADPEAPGKKNVRFANGASMDPNDGLKPDVQASRSRGKSNKICQHWLRGDCHYGSLCFNLHEQPSRNNTSRSDDMDFSMGDVPDDGKGPGSNQAPLPITRMARGGIEHAAVYSGANSDTDMLGSEGTRVDVIQPPAPVSDNTTRSNPQPRRKRTMEDYNETKRQEALGLLGPSAKEFVFGFDETQRAIFDLGDIDQSDQALWKQELASTTKIVLDQICMAQDFQARQGYFQRRAFHHGYLKPAGSDTPAKLKFLNHVVEEMVVRASGLLSVFENFAMLLYPGEREEWSFLEQRTTGESPLRYFLFQHDLEPGIQQTPPKLDYSEPYRTMLAAKIHGLRLKNLLPICDLQKENPYNFFLMFPSSEKQMLDYFSSWILASHAESKVFDSLAEGAWDVFVKTYAKEQKGVIFVHESLAASLHQVPFLKDVILQGGIIWWNVSDSASLYPVFPSIYSDPQKNVGRLRFTRLFPHGCAIFLTPSFLVAEPEHANSILKWFLGSKKGKFASSLPGTWKLVGCHNLTTYLLELANSKAKEKENFERQHRDSPAKDSMLHQKKLSYSHCEERYKLHKTLLTWQQQYDVDLGSDSETNHNDDNESPLVQAPHWIDQDDEEGLINWFAGWSMLKLDTYRKFMVIGTNSSNAPLATRLKESAIPPTSTSDLMAQVPTTCSSPHPIQKQKALEVAARLNTISVNKAKSAEGADSRAEDTDVSMNLEDDPPTSAISKHGIDARLPLEVLTFIAETGCGPEDAHRLLAKANQDPVKALQLHREELFDSKVSGILNGGLSLVTEPPPPLQVLPPLRVGDSDVQRAQQIPDRVPMSAISQRSGQFSPRGEDILSPQFDPSTSRDVSRRTSIVMSPAQMSVGSGGESGVEGGFQGGRFETIPEQPDSGNDAEMNLDSGAEMQMITTTKTFEPTSAWYRRLQQDGKGWGHIIVCSQWDNEHNPGAPFKRVDFAKQILKIP